MRKKYKEQFRLLVKKHNDGTATPEELKILEEYYELFSNESNIAGQLDQNESELLENKIWAKVSRQINTHQKRETPRLVYAKWLAVAATVVFAVVSISLFLNRRPVSKIAAKPQLDIAPGTIKALLILDNGDEVLLDELSSKKISRESGISIDKTAQGQLVYTVFNTAASEPVKYNTIITPAGGQYQIVLSDGTKVWLNSGSSLRFPTSFRGGDRNVELEGEGYFEVAKYRGMRFNVSARDVSVQVLGTHFNVMAYKDERTINTTLLEGSVKVTGANQTKLIAPGQQANVGEDMQVLNVDTKAAVAWKEGYFLFEDENIQSVMRKISRWYNVEIEYKGDIPQKTFGGKIARSRNVSAILNILELSGGIHFKIMATPNSEKERRIIVMP